MRSSYIENDFGLLIKNYVIAWRPVSFVELGVLDGYSTIAIAEGLRELEKLYRVNYKLDSYDLFEDYQFKHGIQEQIQEELVSRNLSQYVNLIKGSAYEVYKNYSNVEYDEKGEQITKGIEFLHIDISNTGKVIHDLIELWHPKIGWRGLILIEGGSEERDEVEWMKKYNFPSIKKEIETNEIINKYYMYGTYYQFPSMTVLIRKWWL